MKRFLAFFLQGLIMLIPLTLTIYILIKLFELVFLPLSLLVFTGNPYADAGLSVVVLIALITLLGVLASSFVLKGIFGFFEDKLEHAPFIRHIYSPIKDFMNAFVGNKKRFKKPVIVLTNPLANIEEIGFVTQDDLSDWDLKDKVAVYFPYSYSFSGRIAIVPRENVRQLNAEGAEAMKFILSGGVTDVDKD